MDPVLKNRWEKNQKFNIDYILDLVDELTTSRTSWEIIGEKGGVKAWMTPKSRFRTTHPVVRSEMVFPKEINIKRLREVVGKRLKCSDNIVKSDLLQFFAENGYLIHDVQRVLGTT